MERNNTVIINSVIIDTVMINTVIINIVIINTVIIDTTFFWRFQWDASPFKQLKPTLAQKTNQGQTTIIIGHIQH